MYRHLVMDDIHFLIYKYRCGFFKWPVYSMLWHCLQNLPNRAWAQNSPYSIIKCHFMRMLHHVCDIWFYGSDFKVLLKRCQLQAIKSWIHKPNIVKISEAEIIIWTVWCYQLVQHPDLDYVNDCFIMFTILNGFFSYPLKR